MTQDTDIREQALSYIRHQATKSMDDLAALIERTAADCARCLEDVSEGQASFQYDQEWSMKEVLGHMIESGKGVNLEIANLVEDRPSAREARMGVVAGADRTLEEMRQMLTDLWRRTGRLVGSLPEDGILERTWDHPMFGSLNFREWIAFQRLHAMDHVQQMEKVKAHSDDPKA